MQTFAETKQELYEKQQAYRREVDAELLACRQLLYQISRKGQSLKLLKAAKGFLRMTANYKGQRIYERSPGEDAGELLLN